MGGGGIPRQGYADRHTLVAARGHMTMAGGAGADTFVFNFDNLTGKHNTAVITDYDPKVDQLQVLNDTFVAVSSDHRGGTILHVDNETVDLPGVRPKELHDWA